MSGIDLLILVWVILAIARGYRVGFLRQIFSFAGFIAGLLFASWLAPYVADYITGSASSLIFVLLLTLIIAAVGASLAELAAARLLAKIKLKHVHAANKGLGSAFSVIAVLISAWIIASALSRLPIAGFGISLQRSKILTVVERVMPPAPAVMEKLGRILSPHGFPRVFIGDEPYIDPAGPPATPEVESAAAKAKESTVRIEGTGCGGVSVGSGFVAAPGYVVTNAHVVAGVRQPIISDQAGRHKSIVVWFDPDTDMAVLKTDKLSGPPLALAEKRAERGTSAAILGYPGGGRLTIDPAVILTARQAVGRDIYDNKISTREIYAVQAFIEPGNSGGPLVLADGSVAGVMFGAAVSRQDLSYALTSDQVYDDVQTAITRTQQVSSGPCVAG